MPPFFSFRLLILLGVSLRTAYAKDPLSCEIERLAPSYKLDVSLEVKQVPPDKLLVDAVDGMISIPQILRIERMLDAQGDGLGLTPTLAESPKGQTEANLKEWTSRVDEYFAGAEFNDSRKSELEALFLDYVNHPPAGYLPGFEPGPRVNHPTVSSYYTSSYGRREHDVAVRTLQNSVGFLDVVDSSRDDRQRLERAMKVRSGYFMMKLLQWGVTNSGSLN